MVSGDTELAARAGPLLRGALDWVSIAVVDRSNVTYAHFGADEQTGYEIGSITKTFTVLLLADAIQRGEMAAETKSAHAFLLGEASIADVTLEESSPATAPASQPRACSSSTRSRSRCGFSASRSFTHDVDELLGIASKAMLTDRGGFVYFNLGAGFWATRWPPRRTGPSTAGRRRAACARPQPTWSATCRRCSTDLRLASTSLTPRWEFGPLHIGYTWMTRENQGQTVTFTNGLTAGFTSKIVLDRTHQRAVIVLTNTATNVDDAAYGLLVLTTFFRSVPRELEDAARIDGAHSVQVLRHVILPLSGPGIAAVTVFQSVFEWNDYFAPLIVIQKPSLFTVQLALSNFSNFYATDQVLLFAGLAIVMVPPLLVFAVLQRTFIQGLTVGAMRD
jgi:hypothetical protein